MNMQSYPNCSLEVFVESLFKSVNILITEKGIDSNCFELNRVPKISLHQYITRVVNYIPCSVEAYIISLIYLHRISDRYPWLINKYSVYLIFITSVLVACKYHDDIFYNNKFYAQVAGIPSRTLNELEVDFLRYVNFDCYITLEEFKQFLNILNFDSSQEMYYSISPSNYIKFPKILSSYKI